MSFEVHHGDALGILRTMERASVDCCITSPPYWKLRDYGIPDQIGCEETVGEYVDKLVAVFEEVRTVLKSGATLWLNIGDCYAGSWGAQSKIDDGARILQAKQVNPSQKRTRTGSLKRTPGLKEKDMIGVPWRLAFALQAAGWWLRSDIVWHKPAPYPESVTDRPTRSHEFIFLLANQEHYHYNATAIQERATTTTPSGNDYKRPEQHRGGDGSEKPWEPTEYRNRRDVWTLRSQPLADNHRAAFPIELPELCLRAGCPEGGVVLDPFAGTSTTGLACLKNGRRFVGIELNPEYVRISYERARRHYPLLVA